MARLQRMLKLLLCIGLLTALPGCTETQMKESTGQFVDDSVITTKVKTAIFNDVTLKTLQITVETYKGMVQLSGFVDSAASAAKAGEVARSVEGVKGVQNNLIVK